MPDDGLWGPDGERQQAHLKRSVELRGRTRTSGFTEPELGLVTDRYYKDDESNLNGVYTEYDVFIIRHSIFLRNVPMKSPYQGESGGFQITLKPATTVPEMNNPDSIWKNVMDSDGDLVCVQYIGGKWPVIDGCMNHIRADGAPWISDSTEGEVASFYYNTTRQHIDDAGNIHVTMDSGGSSDRSITITVDGTQFLRIYQDGAGVVRIELGNNTGEKVILGETFRDWINKNIPLTEGGLVHHSHNVTAPGPGTYETTEPIVPGTGLTTVLPISEMPSSHLTDKVKAEG